MTQGQIFKAGFNNSKSELSFQSDCHTTVKEPIQPYYLFIAGRRIVGIHTLPKGSSGCTQVNNHNTYGSICPGIGEKLTVTKRNWLCVYAIHTRCIHLILCLILIYRAGFSGLLSVTCLSGLRFILVSVLKTFLIFRRLYSPQFPRQPHCWRTAILGVRSLRHLRLHSLTLPNWLFLKTEPTNRKTAKEVSQGSSLVYHITGYFPWLF